MTPTAEYGPEQLESYLLELQRNKASGIVRLTTKEEGLERTIAFREGAIVYAGREIPTPRQFILELSKQLQIGVIDTVLEFAGKRSSVQSLLSTMVQIEVLRWPDIITGMRKHAIVILQELLPTSGRITFEPDTETFDLCYDGQPSSWFAVDALLLEISLKKKRERPVPPPPPLPKAPPPKPDVVDRRPVVLSVDDSPIAQALVKRALSQDYRIKACSSAIEALAFLNRNVDVAIMLLDLTMPDIDGLEFCRTVRKIGKFKSLPIIMLTARDGMMDRLRGRMAGTNHYLTKPVKPAELVEAVAQYVG